MICKDSARADLGAGRPDQRLRGEWRRRPAPRLIHLKVALSAARE
jgi:hypothetical protein